MLREKREESSPGSLIAISVLRLGMERHCKSLVLISAPYSSSSLISLLTSSLPLSIFLSSLHSHFLPLIHSWHQVCVTYCYLTIFMIDLRKIPSSPSFSFFLLLSHSFSFSSVLAFCFQSFFSHFLFYHFLPSVLSSPVHSWCVSVCLLRSNDVVL